MEPADHRRQRLGRLLARTPRPVGDARRIGRDHHRRQLARRIEALEIRGSDGNAAAQTAHDDAVGLAAEPVAVTAQRSAHVVGEAESERDSDGGVEQRDEVADAGRAERALPRAQELAQAPADDQRDRQAADDAGQQAPALVFDDAGEQRRHQHEGRGDGDEQRNGARRQDDRHKPATKLAHHA